MTGYLRSRVILLCLILLGTYGKVDEITGKGNVICKSKFLLANDTLQMTCEGVLSTESNVGYVVGEGVLLFDPICEDQKNKERHRKLKLWTGFVSSHGYNQTCIGNSEVRMDTLINHNQSDGIVNVTGSGNLLRDMLCKNDIGLKVDITDALLNLCEQIRVNLHVTDFAEVEGFDQKSFKIEHVFEPEVIISPPKVEGMMFNPSTEQLSTTILGSGPCCSMEILSNGTFSSLNITTRDNFYELSPLENHTSAQSNQTLLRYFLGEITEPFRVMLKAEVESDRVMLDDIRFKTCGDRQRKVIFSRLKRDYCRWEYDRYKIKNIDKLCQQQKSKDFCSEVNKESLGNFGVFVTPGVTSLTTLPLPASGQGCTLQLSSLQTTGTGFRVNIVQNNFTFNVASYNKCSQKVCLLSNATYLLGSFGSGSVIEIQLVVNNHFDAEIGVYDVELSNCSVQEYDSACGEFQCKSGACIPQEKVCDLAIDCLDGDDETTELCNNLVSTWKCSFESYLDNNCSFINTHPPNITCGFDVVRGYTVPYHIPIVDHTTKTTEGHFLFLHYNTCPKPATSGFDTEELRILPELVSKDCNMSISSQAYSHHGLSGMRWYAYVCGTDKPEQPSNVQMRKRAVQPCKVIHIGQGNPTWMTSVIHIPEIFNRFYIRIRVSKLYPSEWIAFDDVYFSAGCKLTDSEDLINLGNTEKIERRSDLYKDDHYIVIGLSTSIIMTSLIFLLIIVSRKRHKDNCRSFICGKVRERLDSSTVVKGDSKQISVKAVNSSIMINHLMEVLLEDNPNYEWYSQRILNDQLTNISRCRLRYYELIGKGAFGEVYKGVLIRRSSKQKDTKVAIKKLPANSSEQSRSDILLEAFTLSKFNHPNIVQCLGVCVDSDGLSLVLELLPGGDLKTFLCKTKAQKLQINLQTSDLLSIILDIANGCQYLERVKFIHRDLAARNCLLTSTGPDRVAKLADFGLARDIKMNESYCKVGQAMLPIRLMSPETYTEGIYTLKSDVWAFGILLWEVFTIGETPYPTLSNSEVMLFVSSGKRLHSPPNCPESVYNLMTRCWQADPNDRPSFNFLYEQLIIICKELSVADCTQCLYSQYKHPNSFESKDYLAPLIKSSPNQK